VVQVLENAVTVAWLDAVSGPIGSAELEAT
jgi:hypothetical protein